MRGAVAIDDPFGAVDTSLPTVCAGKDPTLIVSVNITMPPGIVICSDVQVKPGVTLTLAPGEQYLNYGLLLGAGRVLSGSDVAVFFGPTSVLNVDNQSTVSLSG